MTIIPPHKVKSREVMPGDYDRVAKDAAEMLDIMEYLVQKGVWANIAALAHAQVTDQDPLRFFVLRPAMAKELEWTHPVIIVNPMFTPQSYATLKTEYEQCVTFPKVAKTKTLRYYKGKLKFLGENEIIEDVVKGKLAQICQHEIDHFYARYIYGAADGINISTPHA